MATYYEQITETMNFSDDTLGIILDKIKISDHIPEQATDKAIDFVSEKFEQLLNYTGDLLNFPVPDSFADWWPAIVEIIKNIL